jgi:hypothetical protein
MKNKKYHNVRTISKYNQKIVETEIFGEKLSQSGMTPPTPSKSSSYTFATNDHKQT